MEVLLSRTLLADPPKCVFSSDVNGIAKAMLDSRFVAPVTDAIADSCGVMCSADLGGRHTYEMYVDHCETR